LLFELSVGMLNIHIAITMLSLPITKVMLTPPIISLSTFSGG